ncbi:sulfur carrier protein ThiS [Halanaerobiaceae bacterium ANBcell28]
MAEINIKVNDKAQTIEEKSSVLDLLKKQDINPEVAVVKLNDNILDKGDLEKTILNENDQLEVIFFMGGGSFDFSEEEIERYSRHIILKDIGGTGQQKIKEASVLVVGAGGLGSPVSLYLAAAGVGKLGLIDSDVVDLSNLQRQVIHTTADLDKPKVESAAETLRSINPHVDVKTYNTYLNKENIMDIIDEYDIIVDGVDNFPTRYLLNDACVMKGKTLVEAGILRFEGQVMTIKPGEGPCYRCVFTNPPAEGTIPSCQQAGVLGAIAGTIGTIQATEVIKLITGIGTPLIGKILIYDALDMSFRKVDLKKNADCPVCGDNPSITELMEYEISCQLHG